MAWVNVNVIGRVFLDQGFLPFTELVRVLINVLGIDTKQRFFFLERVDPKSAIGYEAGRRLGQTTFIGRNAAVGVTRLGCPERGEGFTKVRDITACRQGVGRHAHQGNG
ncbi:hypothetical protein D3C85_985460 [compost metagenome]